MKRILALLLVLATVLTFAACKGKTDETTTTTGSSDNGVTVGAEVSDDSTTAASESGIDSQQAASSNKTGSTSTTKKPTSLIGSNTVVKPSTDNVVRPTKKVYKITVTTNADGAKIVTIDGEEYNLKKADDVAKLKARIEAEKENDLLGQIYDVDPTVAANLGLDELDEGSLLSYKYDPEGEFFYVDDINSWQQDFGFNPLYDFAAGYVGMPYDTVRLKFNYQGTGYMLQLWKGQYGAMFIGSEIGFYKKDDNTPISSNPALDHYDCATDHLLPMEMVCYRVDARGVLNPLFKRKYELHWWSTGFVPGLLKNLADRSELLMEARITFDNAEMTQIVADTFKVNGFKQISKSEHNIYHPDTYYVSGNDIVFTWRYIKHSKDIIILAPTTKTTAPATSSAPSESAE